MTIRDRLFGTRVCLAPDDGAGGGAGGGTEGAAPGAGAAEGKPPQGDNGAGSVKDASQGGAGEKEGQKQPDDWRASIDDEKLRDHAGRFTSPKHLAQAHLELRTKLSNAIFLPGKDAKPEEVAEYRKKLGVPETHEGYKFPDAGRDLTDEEKASREEWAKFFHEQNIPASVAEKLVAKYGEVASAIEARQVEDDKRFAAQSEEHLRREWGPDYDRNKEFANRAFSDLASRAGVPAEELRQIETKAGRFVLDDPRMVRIFAVIGRAMGEGNLGPVVSQDQVARMEGELAQVRQAIDAAKSRGDSKEANRLYQQEQQIIARLHGNRPAVGAMGRAA